MFCPNCKGKLESDRNFPDQIFTCTECNGQFEIERREDQERLNAHLLFVAEVKKAGGPMDRIGDFIQDCSDKNFEQFIEDLLPRLEQILREFKT